MCSVCMYTCTCACVHIVIGSSAYSYHSNNLQTQTITSLRYSGPMAELCNASVNMCMYIHVIFMLEVVRVKIDIYGGYNDCETVSCAGSCV